MLKPSRRKIVISTIAGLAGFTAAITTTQAQTQPHKNQNMSNNTSQQASDKIEIIETVNKIALMSDLRDWEEVIAQFTEPVEFDYTSLTGGQASTVAAQTQVKQWEEFFAQTFKTTQHILGSHAVTVNGDKATCISHFQAHHVFLDSSKGQSWTLGGTYNHELTRTPDGWKVNKMKMTATWEEGKRPF